MAALLDGILGDILDDAVAARVFSGYQFASWHRRGAVTRHGGVTGYWPGAVPVTADTRFDLGSVTKTVATTSLVALAVQEGKAALGDELGRHLPELRGTPLAPLVLSDLLCHASGLIGWFPFYEEFPGGDRAALLRWLGANASRLLRRAPGEAAEYSDPGFLLLGLAVQSWYGELRSAFAERVAKPCAVTTLDFGPVPTGLTVAATEYCLWRRRLLQGEVFDENCAHLGGVCGHAGLFGTAVELARLGTAWLDARAGRSRWLGAELARRFTGHAGRVAGSLWCLGWDGKSRTGSTAGDRFSPSSFGSLGYPGASLWIDPEAEGVAVLLTNRIHPSRFDERIRAVRPRVHDAIAGSWRSEGVKR